MSTISAWLVSANSLSNRVQNFFGKEMKVEFFSCPQIQPTKYDNQIKKNLNDLFPTLGLLTGQKNFQALATRCGKAKVHAEAGLMSWVYGQGASQVILLRIAKPL